MEPVAATAVANTPKVIELVIEEVEHYELTWGIQINTQVVRAVSPRPTGNKPLSQQPLESKPRPIAKVLPAIRQQRKRSESIENDIKGETLLEVIKPSEGDEESTGDLNSVKILEEEKNNINLLTKSLSEEEDKEEKVLEEDKEEKVLEENKVQEQGEKDLAVISNSSSANETKTLLDENLSKQETSPNSENESHSPRASDDKFLSKLEDNEKQTKESVDPCGCHRNLIRNNLFHKSSETKIVGSSNSKPSAVPCACHQDWIRNKFFQNNSNTNVVRSSKSKPGADPCGCHRDWIRNKFSQINSDTKVVNSSNSKMDCGDEGGCHQQSDEIQTHKETAITDCLDEFLANLHLSHLVDYLKVLGCMCVRDLRLLEMPELEAIQLISRRRLLQQLNTLTLHHEAPPADCSLEAWLTWYGLTHISGFLAAIGVHSVGDLGYLNEDDLLLLKPVTRRRLLACNKKHATKGGETHGNDYLM